MRWSAQVVEAKVEEKARSGVLEVELPRTQPDGAVVRYRLLVAERKGEVQVREADPSRFPRGCPLRHIDGAGVFCLEWPRPRVPKSSQEAIALWRTLSGYLELQEEATLTRGWRVGHGRAHGDPAVKIEHAYESLLRHMPRGVREAVQSGSVKLTESRDRLTAPEAPCPCGSGLASSRCHERELVKLASQRVQLSEAENAYWQKWAKDNPTCCELMDCCPLSKSVASTNQSGNLSSGQRWSRLCERSRAFGSEGL
jgi:hypothetical protein